MALAIRQNKAGFWQPVMCYQVPLAAGIMADNTVVDTGYDLPDEGVVVDVALIVDTAETTASTKTIDVGIINAGESGDEDGFLDGVATTPAGEILPSLTNGSVTRGAYLREVSGEAGEHSPAGYALNGTAKSVAVTSGDAGGQTEFAGRLLFYVRHDPNGTGWRQAD
jgi:hypothetical protein